MRVTNHDECGTDRKEKYRDRPGKRRSPPPRSGEERAGSADGYTRHTLHAEATFSISAVVWRPGQLTEIHDHLVWCSFVVLQGAETENLFDIDGDRLVQAGQLRRPTGSVSGVAPPDDIHQVHNTGDSVAVTLHVYGADLSTGTSVRRTYHSGKKASHMDTTALHDAFHTLLEAAATVAEAGPAAATPPAGEWHADQILAHVSIVNAATIFTLSAIIAGTHATYDNRISHDAWTLTHVIDVAGGNVGLRERIRAQGEALRALAGPMLSEAELDTQVPARLVSQGTVLIDQPIPLRDILTGLADVELPGHAAQLRALLPAAVTA
jgi:mannose-6-phosphate isomerase-like protein (cupin superfamily)